MRNKNFKKLCQKYSRFVASVFFLLPFLTGCFEDTKASKFGGNNREREMKKISVTSNAFSNGESISSLYTCDGDDISPPLNWKGIPDGTKSIALICDDPDAPMGTWVHWVVFNLPPGIKTLSQDVDIISLGGREGKNSWGNRSYGGPCPPDGQHRYFFTLYALDTILELDEFATKQDVIEQIESDDKKHLLATGQLMGLYQRS